ncbi:SIMPL domain-containing protein [Rugosimonospora africana]|uniref:SIMPL domain-containing protein n=1 Tax=Rugosimonospora africana TaxID=556532 RepID=A0A8J3QPC4_9ACTN|nr:SIMPL domain-containing protein [Rugosimonospora africana]GIH12711.1 hypothetical protein Raf01_08830 [Rugosimonospora africana]
MERDASATGPVVAVRGEVFYEVPPDIATFSVTASAFSKDRQEVLQELTDRVGSLREVLDAYADAISERATGGMSMNVVTKRDSEKVGGYRASVTTTVTVHDFTVLGDLMLRLGDHARTALSGPWWALRPGSPVHREARTAAVGDAVARAREYAEALGARVVGLIELSDIGLGGRPDAMPRAMTLAGHSQWEKETPQLDLEPQRQQVRTAVEARFLISEATVLSEPPA